MFGSIKIAVIRGIPVRVHFSLFLALILLVFQLGWLGLPAGILLFASVLAHELGHSLVAQRYGLGIAGIDLHLLGGTALMRSAAATPSQEIRIALAGPAVSIGLGLSLALLAAGLGLSPSFAQFGIHDVIPYLAAVNLAMGLFNLIPALPMDGGRVLRALLAKRFSLVVATRIAARLARALAVVFVVAGLYAGAFTLPLIGLLIFALSRQEERQAEAIEAQRKQQELERLWWFWRAPMRTPLRTVVIDSRPVNG